MKSFHRGHNQHVRPDEKMGAGKSSGWWGLITPRQRRSLKRDANRKRRTRERRLENEQ